MSKQESTRKILFESIYKRYYALLNSLLLLLAITLYLHLSSKINPLLSKTNFLFILVPVILILGIVFGNILSKVFMKDLHKEKEMTYRLNQYRYALRVKFALPSLSSFLGIIVYGLTGNLTFIIMLAVSIAWLIYIKPTEDKIVAELEL